MRVALIQTPWTEASEGEYAAVYKSYTVFPPLGLMSLSAAMEEAGHPVDLIDLDAEPLPLAALCERIRAFKADVVGLTATTPVAPIAEAYAKALKKRLGLPIVLGGPHVTAVREAALAPEVDFAVMNEGERTFPEFAREFEGGRDFAKVDGLIHRAADGSPRVNRPRPFIEDLDALPFPSRDKVPPSRYAFEVPGKGVVPVPTVEFTRGCPFHCVFCAERLNVGSRLRRRSPRRIVDEMLGMKERWGTDHFSMLASTLTADREHVKAFCAELIARRAGVTFEGQTRANILDPELLALMKRAGLVRLTLGLESADPEVLRLARKGVSTDELRAALRACRELGVATQVSAMIGNPGDTVETVLATARFVRDTPEIMYSPFSIAIPYPGTELHAMAAEGRHGLKLLQGDLRRFSRYAGGMMEVGGLAPADLLKLQRRALFIAHSTPSKVWGLLRHFGVLNMARIGLVLLRGLASSRLGARESILTRLERETSDL